MQTLLVASRKQACADPDTTRSELVLSASPTRGPPDTRMAPEAAVGDTRPMPEESTTPDLVERWRHAADAFGRSDFDAGLSSFAPDAVWEVPPLASSFEGLPAIRRFVEDWIGNYDEYHQELVEGQDLGNDVVFALNRQDARLAGTTSRVQELWSFTVTWRAGMIERVIGRNDIDEARAAAKRLAQERG